MWKLTHAYLHARTCVAHRTILYFFFLSVTYYNMSDGHYQHLFSEHIISYVHTADQINLMISNA